MDTAERTLEERAVPEEDNRLLQKLSLMASFKKAAPLYLHLTSMLTSATKRFNLPFSNPKTTAPEVEAAAVFAVAELERNKGGGLISRQPEEKLVFLSKIGYPLWLFPKNDVNFVFDGFDDSSYSISYAEVPSAKAFLESLEANSRPREKYIAFLSDHSSYFQQPIKEKQFVFKGLIADVDFRNEFSVYCKEASEANHQANSVLLSPTLEENSNFLYD